MKKILFLLTALTVSTFSGKAYSEQIISNPDGSKTHYLSINETITGEFVGRWDRITCAGQSGPINPPPPSQPNPPPPPPCQASRVQSEIQAVWSEAQRIANGKCLQRAYVSHCGNDLEEHALADTKIAFANEMRNARNQVESICRAFDNSCTGYDIQSVTRAYRDLARFVQTTPLRISGGRTFPMVDDSSLFMLNCRY